MMILATWLSQAAAEEQTSVLLVVLNVCMKLVLSTVWILSLLMLLTISMTIKLNVVQVLCHLPLQMALPVHMSAILQSVNRLRFYRASGVPTWETYFVFPFSLYLFIYMYTYHFCIHVCIYVYQVPFSLLSLMQI